MRAIECPRYGLPEKTLRLTEVETPTPRRGEVLVRVVSACVNPADWFYATGTPYLIRLVAGILRPRTKALGMDGAGVVEAVGEDAGGFNVGERVFGVFGRGAYAEYGRVKVDRLARLPSGVSFEEASAIPTAGMTALQALRDHGALRSGQRLLVNGASGGIGTFAVQIAKAMGAHVTGVCSERNVEMVRELGADVVVDYSRADFTVSGERYDVIADTVSNRTFEELRCVMTDHGVCVSIGAKDMGDWIWPVLREIRIARASQKAEKRFVSFVEKPARADLEELAGLMESGKMRSVISERFELAQTGEALRRWRAGHARGKSVIRVSEPGA